MARAALDWSLDDLAAAAKIGRATIARFENGTDARDETVAALRAAIECAGISIIASGEISKAGGAGVRFTSRD
jgi:transcriptional regulator with XRE-family HTH domain